MKKRTRYLAPVLAAVLLLCAAGCAAEAEGTWAELTNTLSGSDLAATFSLDANEKIINMEVTGAAIHAGEQYTVLMVKGTQDDYTVSPDNILYIDTAEAAGEDAGTVSFKLYPSGIQDSVILLSGSTVDGSPIVVAVVKPAEEP